MTKTINTSNPHDKGYDLILGDQAIGSIFLDDGGVWVRIYTNDQYGYLTSDEAGPDTLDDMTAWLATLGYRIGDTSLPDIESIFAKWALMA